MKNPNKRPAVFIDRDGTLIEEVNYLSRVDDLRIFSFTADALRSLKEEGFLTVVVTNQSGIGRGIFNEAEMHAIHDAIQSELDGAIDAFYFCPHLPCDGCTCRKPGLGMIMTATNDHDIDLAHSWIIGDKKIDVETGRAAGIRSVFVLTGYGASQRLEVGDSADVVAADLGEAVREIIART